MPDHSTEFAGYINYNYKGTRLILDPSIRIQNYTSLGETSIEPRLGLKYNLTENIRIKGSFGMFSQNLMSTSSERDVVNLFQVFYRAQQVFLNHFKAIKLNQLFKNQHTIFLDYNMILIII